MKSTVDKSTTLRVAVAEAQLVARPEILEALLTGNTPKGNAIDNARVAGVMAAKRTWELIPYCHPLPLDQVIIDFERLETAIVARATVTAIWKTGVEMEALMAANVAALTLYDMGKGLDPNMEIQNVRLIEKRGGKSDFKVDVPDHFRVAVVTISDATHAGRREDKSGQLIIQRLKKYGVKAAAPIVLPDEQGLITSMLNKLCAEGVSLILTTGGTGLGTRDVTVEATRQVIDREVPGVAEAMRNFGQQRTPYAMLSRGIVGARGNTLIVNLPGSAGGVEESLNAIFPALLHAYPIMAGGGHA